MTSAADVVIRRARVDDARRLTDLHIARWDDAYTGLVPQHFIDDRRAAHEKRGQRWGGILAGDTRDEQDMEVHARMVRAGTPG